MRINISAFPSKSWLALSLWLVSSICPGTLPAYAADTIAISNIFLNQNNQLVVEFDNPNHITPIAPQVLDCLGDKHDIVLEFANTSFAVGKVPRAKIVLDELTKAFTNVSSIAYAASNDATKARIRLSVSKDISIHPSLTKVDQDSAIINLDLPIAVPATTAATPVITAAAPATTAAAPAITTAAPAANIAAPAITTVTPIPNGTEKPVPPQAVTTTSEAATPTANDGLTSKAMHGIHGAWQSTLKAGTGPVNKIAKLFGSNKEVDSQKSAEQEPTTPVASASTSEVIHNNPAAAPAAVAAATTTAADGNTAAVTTIPAITTTTNTTIATTAVTTTDATIAAQSIVAPNSTPSTASEQSAAAKTADNVVALVPMAIPTTATADNTTNIVPAISPPLTTDISPPQSTATKEPPTTSTSAANIDKKLLDLPRITMQSHESAPKDDLIAPIAANDSPIVADPKSDSEPTATKEAKQPSDVQGAQKESSVKVASAAVNDTANLPPANDSEAETKKIISKGMLKAMAAQSGGKDYFPPKAPEGQEPGYAEETLKHYNEAVRFHLAGNLPEAIAEYRAALAGNPRMEEAHSNLGLIFNQQNKYDQAMSEFHKALAINPKDAITYNGIGAAMRAQKNMLAAVKNWQAAISLDPKLASAHYNLGTAYEIDRDLEKALTEYKLAVKCDDKLGEAYYHMGLILQKMNNNNLALEQFKQAVKVSSQADYTQDAKHRVNLLSQKKDSNNM